MDGVVADSHPVHIKAWRKLLASMGKKVIDADLEVVRDGRKKEDMLRHFFGDLAASQIQAYGAEKDRLFAEEIQNIKAVAGIRELLRELAKAAIPLGMASSGATARVRRMLDLLDLSGFFAAVVTGDEVTIGKPHPAGFRKAAERLQVPAGELLVFEDAVSGVKGAAAAGMRCFGIAKHRRAATLIQAGAERVFPDFRKVSVGYIRKSFDEVSTLPE